MSTRIVGVVVVLFACSGVQQAAAQAHTDINLSVQGGDLIANGFGCPDTTCGTGVVIPTRVFSEAIDGATFYVQVNPGFRSTAGDLPASLDVEWDFLPMTVDEGPGLGHTATLLYWDGVGSEAAFGPAPTDDYILGFYGKDPVFDFAFTGSGDEIVPGAIAFTSTPNGAVHNHGFFLLDDDGDLQTPATSVDPGIYAVSMRFHAQGVTDTEPVFVLLNTTDTPTTDAVPIATAWVEERVDALFVDGLAGDFNGDGFVNAADYSKWRDDLDAGATIASQYNLWALNHGASAAGAATAIPEPGTVVLILTASGVIAGGRRRTLDG